jgi:hypothetical protein
MSNMFLDAFGDCSVFEVKTRYQDDLEQFWKLVASKGIKTSSRRMIEARYYACIAQWEKV